MPTPVVATYRTDVNVNCLVRCAKAPHVFLCGLYQLSEDCRVGGLEVIHINTHPSSKSSYFKRIGYATSAGVFDICELQEAELSSNSSFVCALSDGNVRLITLLLDDEEDKADFSLCQNLQMPVISGGSNPIVTCVHSADKKIIAGDNVGRLHDIKVRDGKMTMSRSWDGHSIFGGAAEVWTVKLSAADDQLVYSGGDDSILKGWDLRTPDEVCMQMTEHTAGVTCVSECPSDPNLVVSGSYDNSVKLFDRRNWSASLQTLDVGGGAWQLVWHSDKSEMLVACMYNGWSRLKLANGQMTNVGGSDEYGEYLNYGVEWADNGYAVASTFYDASVRLWHL